jgi:hypothetical protein
LLERRVSRSMTAMALTGGRMLASVALLGAVASGLGACYDFDFVEPATPPDAAVPTDARPSASCIVDRAYCGGDLVSGDKDTLYRCLGDGGGDLVAKCANGCVPDAGVSAGGAPSSACKPATSCVVTGTYCGGDKLDGDPRILYRCAASGVHAIVERCANGCVVAAEGKDDACKR